MISKAESDAIQHRAVELFKKRPDVGCLKIGLFSEVTNKEYDLEFSILIERSQDAEVVKNLLELEMSKDDLIYGKI